MSADLVESPPLKVRQGGGSGEQGLLSKIKGPAAMLDYARGPIGRLEGVAGAMDGSGRTRGYVAGSGKTEPLAGSELKLNYAADEKGGFAVETRLSKAFDDIRLSWSTTQNRGFESDWTGSGATRATRMNEAWLHWSPSATIYGAGFRETSHADGSHSTDFRAMQMMPAGSGTLVNSTALRLSASGADKASGSLIYYGPLGSFRLTAEIDYADFRPTTALLGVERSIDRSWTLYLSANQSLSSKEGSVDFGASREIGGFVASLYGGATESGSAYMGVRFSVALSPGARQERWMGLK